MAEMPQLLNGYHDNHHRCQLFINPNHENPPQTFRLRTVKTPWSIENRFLEHLEAYGLLHFANIAARRGSFTADPSLLTSLVDRWRPETHTFHFRCGELAPTLKDVSMITALPIRGVPVVHPRVSPNWPADVSARLRLEMPISDRSGPPRGVPHSWLRINFEILSTHADPETTKRHLFAYLLWLFGVMFPNSHGDVVLPGLIYFAAKIVDEPLPQNPPYSFGSALLSHTYRGLCDATQKTAFTSKAPLLCVSYEFLQLWSWEYLPVGRPQIVEPATPYNYGEGVVTMSTRWMLGRKKWSTKIAKNCYPIYHDQFELLNDSLITWNPWTEAHIDMVFGSQHMPVECVRDNAFWMTRCNLLYLWFVEPYNPDRVMRQFGLYQDVPPPVPRCIDEETHK
uniref:Aminotransferase-like plant mobile domain-containing protein n=1 Tax=Hordeum vulgare subsp. vulgare TaxID=112509 RepID=A0A8I6XRZ5_HORVV